MLPDLGVVARLPSSSQHGPKAQKGNHEQRNKLHWLFHSGLALCQGEANGPEHSQMQADGNVDCLYSEAQDLCTNLGGASGQMRGDGAIKVQMQSNLTECIGSRHSHLWLSEAFSCTSKRNQRRDAELGL